MTAVVIEKHLPHHVKQEIDEVKDVDQERMSLPSTELEEKKVSRLDQNIAQLLVTQRHLLFAADNMRPSVTATERRRYQYM